MKKNKLVSMFLVVAILTTLLIGCSSNKEETGKTDTSGTTGTAKVTESASVTSAAEETGIVRVGISSDPANFDPFAPSGNGKNATFPVVFECLADYQGVGGPIKGVIAKDWEKISDMVYRITIYDYVYDTAGNHITASDVAWSFNTEKESGNYNDLKYMVRMDVIDEFTVELEINSPMVGLFEKIVTIGKVISEAAYTADPEAFSSNPVGTTHYKVVEYVSGSKIAMEQTGNYWQTDESLWGMYQQANADRIEFHIIAEESQLVIALETGVIDMANGISAKNVTRFEEDDNYNTFTELQNLSQVLFFNCDPSNPFNSKELRQAVLYAFDIQGIIDGAADGAAVACSTFGGNMFTDYNPEWEKTIWYEYNVDKAKELLAAAGYQPGELTIRVVSNGNTIRKNISQILQGYLAVIGINVDIITYEDALFNTYKYEPAEWDILLDNCGSSDYLVTLWRGKFDARSFKNGGANFVQDEKFHELMITAATEHTIDSMNAFQNELYDNAYGVGLFNAQFFNVTAADCTEICLDAKQFLNPACSVYTWN
ncbi:MAG: ABC transporter substrate-binding protein [Mobilitalea sp.]